MRRRRFCLTLGSLAATSAWSAKAGATRDSIARTSKAFGTQIRIVLRHDSNRDAEAALTAAFDRVDRVEQLMSLYRPESQLSRLNRTGRLVKPDPMMIDIFERAAVFSNATAGAFDITVQPLWELFTKARSTNREPNDAELQTARRRVGWDRVRLEEAAISLATGTRVTLNGIAQGYATDLACQALLDHGVQHALIDIGELAGVGSRNDHRPWQVGIQHPRANDAYVSLAQLSHRCLATSGDYESHFTSDYRCHHIFDPRTGRSPATLSSVSVMAPTAIAADAYSTALMVMGLDRAVHWLSGRNQIDAMFVTKSGHASATPGFSVGKEP